jgi:hypothetical protein
VREGVLASADLDFLQNVYESATEGLAPIDDATMHDVVRELIRHYHAGARDRHWLVILAESRLRRAVSQGSDASFRRPVASRQLPGNPARHGSSAR